MIAAQLRRLKAGGGEGCRVGIAIKCRFSRWNAYARSTTDFSAVMLKGALDSLPETDRANAESRTSDWSWHVPRGSFHCRGAGPLAIAFDGHLQRGDCRQRKRARVTGRRFDSRARRKRHRRRYCNQCDDGAGRADE